MTEDDLPISELQHKLGALYFVRSGEQGLIKIGRTSNFELRVKTLQTGSAAPLQAVGVFESLGWQEAIWHRAFAAVRLGGEWFEPTPDLLASIEHFREHWDWPRAFDGAETELLLDLIDIVGEAVVCGDLQDAAELKHEIRRAEECHRELAGYGMYDERFQEMMLAYVAATTPSPRQPTRPALAHEGMTSL